MLEIAIMIEGQNGLNWPRWQGIVRAVEELGFTGLYRSDHYTNANPPDKDSLELWVSLTWLAANTERIEFGPLVSPVSFRDPTMTARMASAVDDLSNGRLTLGLGAGWQEREHENFGWQLLDIPERFDRFEEGLTVISQLLQNDEPVDFEGEYYELNEAIVLPRPQRPGGPPILIGGNGMKRTLPLTARFAQWWNGIFLTPSGFAKRVARLGELLEENGRSPQEMRYTLMTGTIFGKDEAELEAKLSARNTTAQAMRDRGLIVGTPAQLPDQLAAYEAAGVQRMMLQWLDLDDLDGLAVLAQAVL
jgi:F420-dependent oxidoreductase-like protein